MTTAGLTTVSRTERPEPKIKFSRYWMAIGQDEVLNAVSALSERDMLSAELKLLFLAIGNANNGGHAGFLPGELEQALATVDKTTGELRPMTRRNIENLKKKLAAAGLLVDASGGMRCVWLNASVFQRNRQHGNWSCNAHKTAARGYK